MRTPSFKSHENPLVQEMGGGSRSSFRAGGFSSRPGHRASSKGSALSSRWSFWGIWFALSALRAACVFSSSTGVIRKSHWTRCVGPSSAIASRRNGSSSSKDAWSVPWLTSSSRRSPRGRRSRSRPATSGRSSPSTAPCFLCIPSWPRAFPTPGARPVPRRRRRLPLRPDLALDRHHQSRTLARALPERTAKGGLSPERI